MAERVRSARTSGLRELVRAWRRTALTERVASTSSYNAMATAERLRLAEHADALESCALELTAALDEVG